MFKFLLLNIEPSYHILWVLVKTAFMFVSRNKKKISQFYLKMKIAILGPGPEVIIVHRIQNILNNWNFHG